MTFIAFVDALIIPCAVKRHRDSAITQREERNLLTFEELLNDDFGSCGFERGLDGGLGLVNRFRNDYPFARGKPINFNYNRRPTAADIALRLIGMSEPPIVSCWYAKFPAKVLGISLRAFEPSRISRWPEARYASVR